VHFDRPFRGSDALAAGLVTRGRLRGPRFRRVFEDVYVAADVPLDLALRSHAAHLLVAGRGVLAGYSAAEVLGASCGPADAPAPDLVAAEVRRELDRAAERLGLPKIPAGVAGWR
jgi:hypothetical protein